VSTGGAGGRVKSKTFKTPQAEEMETLDADDLFARPVVRRSRRARRTSRGAGKAHSGSLPRRTSRGLHGVFTGSSRGLEEVGEDEGEGVCLRGRGTECKGRDRPSRLSFLPSLGARVAKKNN
jgi:hypothetical protein